MEQCLTSLHACAWFCHNRLFLNGDKSILILSTRQRPRTFPASNSIIIASSSVAVSKQVTTFGVILDNDITFDSHVFGSLQKIVFHLRALRHIYVHALTDDMSVSLYIVALIV